MIMMKDTMVRRKLHTPGPSSHAAKNMGNNIDIQLKIKTMVKVEYSYKKVAVSVKLSSPVHYRSNFYLITLIIVTKPNIIAKLSWDYIFILKSLQLKFPTKCWNQNVLDAFKKVLLYIIILNPCTCNMAVQMRYSNMPFLQIN